MGWDGVAWRGMELRGIDWSGVEWKDWESGAIGRESWRGLSWSDGIYPMLVIEPDSHAPY